MFAVGAVLAVLAIIFGILGLRRARRSRRRKGLAIAGLVTGALGVPIAVGGLVFTIVVFRAIDRYENPPDATTSIESCLIKDGRARAEGELRNDGDRTSEFTVYVEFHALPSGRTIERPAEVPSTPPPEFAVRRRPPGRRRGRRVRDLDRQRSPPVRPRDRLSVVGPPPWSIGGGRFEPGLMSRPRSGPA